MKQKIIAVFLAVAIWNSCAGARQPVSQTAQATERPVFVYDDFDAFASAYSKYQSGTDLVTAMQGYLNATSPAFPFFAERYGITAESIAAAVKQRPKYFERLPGLKDQLRRQEETIARGIERLSSLAPGNAPAPVFFLVGNMTAGGSPSELNPPMGSHTFGVAVAVETVAMGPDVDMSEFPGRYAGGYLVDMPYVIVHEMMHVYQARIQGLDNYRSIYRPGPNNTYLALAVREGCADYITMLATGKMRTGDRHQYGLEHEEELWAQFRSVMDKTGSFQDGWFGAIHPQTPDWPPQIGYWLGMRMCEAYHQSSIDPEQAMKNIFAAYAAEDMRKFAESYARKRNGS